MDAKGDTLITEPPAGLSGDHQPAGKHYLIVLCGGIPGAMLGLSTGENWIGRSPDNAIQLNDPTVSRQHAAIHIEENGPPRLVDLGSTNGTFLNNTRLDPHASARMEDGDRLRVGTTCVLKYVQPDPYEEAYQRAMFERTVRDTLTGLYNRSYFMEQVDLLSQKASFQGLGIAVLMIDIDHFKRVNDRFGHPVGDAVLKEVANVLRQSTRSEDLIARYGGEEFVVALPTLSLGRAAERAERIRRALAGRRMRLDPKTSFRVTASIGADFARADRPRPAQLMVSNADYRLYRAKDAGRNCVVCIDLPGGSCAGGDDSDLPLTCEVDPAIHGLVFDSTSSSPTPPITRD